MYPSNVDNFWKFGIKVQTGETVRLAGYKINLPFKTDEFAALKGKNNSQ